MPTTRTRTNKNTLPVLPLPDRSDPIWAQVGHEGIRAIAAELDAEARAAFELRVAA